MDKASLLKLLDRVPYAKTLGIQLTDDPERCLLPARKSNIGNPTLPALHGGAIAGFMELSAMSLVLQHTDAERVPKVVDYSVDYVRAGKFCDTHSRCELVYLGRRMINVRVSAWQEDEASPIAMARVQFLLKDTSW